MMEIVEDPKPKTRTVCGQQKIIERKHEAEIFTCTREIDHTGIHSDGNITWKDKK